MHLLKAVLEHWTVHLPQQRAVDADLEPRSDAEEIPVEGRMVNLAQGQSIRNDRIATKLCVTDDVRSIEQFGMSQSAHRTRRTVRIEHLLTEDGLMETLPRHPGGIDLLRCAQGAQVDPDIVSGEREGELEILRVLALRTPRK